MKLLAVFGGGFWIIPSLAFLAAIVLFYIAYKAHNSGSTQQVDSGTPNVHVESSNENVPYTSIGQFWFAVVCILTFIGTVLYGIFG